MRDNLIMLIALFFCSSCIMSFHIYIYNNVYNRQKGLEREREFSILILHIDLVGMYLIFGV
jgi:hypothetical protein